MLLTTTNSFFPVGIKLVIWASWKSFIWKTIWSQNWKCCFQSTGFCTTLTPCLIFEIFLKNWKKNVLQNMKILKKFFKLKKNSNIFIFCKSISELLVLILFFMSVRTKEVSIFFKYTSLNAFDIHVHANEFIKNCMFSFEPTYWMAVIICWKCVIYFDQILE